MSNIKQTAAQIAQQQAAMRQSKQEDMSEQQQKAKASAGKYGTGSGEHWQPKAVKTIDETGLNIFYLSELVLKVLYFSGFKTGYGIFLFPLVLFLAGSIRPVISYGMAQEAVGLSLNQGGTFPFPGSFYSQGYRIPDRQNIHPVHCYCRHVVGSGSGGYLGYGAGIGHGCGYGIEIIFADKDYRQTENGSQVE